MLVAPVHDPSGDQTIYLPPGQWIDFFNGRRYAGGGAFTAHYAVDETPVFVREGALIPEQGVSDYSNARPLDTVILNVYGSGQGSFELYEDDGVSLAYDKKEYAVTALTYATDSNGLHHLVIGPTQGAFHGQLPAPPSRLTTNPAANPPP